MSAMKAIYAQSALIWSQVAQNKSDVQLIVKIHFSLFIHTHTHTHKHTQVWVFCLHGNFWGENNILTDTLATFSKPAAM